MQVKQLEAQAYNVMKDEFSYANTMQAPRVEKVVIATGIGKIRSDKNKIATIEDRLAKITGQKAAPAQAKKSIAQFKVREGEVSGYKVTLSGKRAQNFLDKMIHIALPRTKDFRGINRSAVDDMGNLTIGVKEHTIFPETGDEDIRDIFGMAVTVVTTASSKQEATRFFEHLGIPFKKLEA